MPGPAQSQAEGLRDRYTQMRNYLAEQAMNVGGAGTSPDAKDILHNEGNRRLTYNLGQVLPPEMAANFSDAAYLGNEALTGAMAVPTGRPFFSDYGFRWDDISRNRQGQEEGMRQLQQEQEAYPNYLPDALSGPMTTVPLGLRKMAGQGLSYLMGD